jgi:hypothetical protein
VLIVLWVINGYWGTENALTEPRDDLLRVSYLKNSSNG